MHYYNYFDIYTYAPLNTAGGLATYLHADMLPDLLPKGIKYKTMADAGYAPMLSLILHVQQQMSVIFSHRRYFLDIPTVKGVPWFSEYMRASKFSDSSCCSERGWIARLV